MSRKGMLRGRRDQQVSGCDREGTEKKERESHCVAKIGTYLTPSGRTTVNST